MVALILFATGFLTYLHYTDPIYNLKVGTSINSEDNRIEQTGGRFQMTDNEIYVGFNTRLDTGTTVELQITNEDMVFPALVKDFYITPSYNFYYVKNYSFMLTPGTYTVSVYIDEELMEETTFILEEPDLDQ